MAQSSWFLEICGFPSLSLGTIHRCDDQSRSGTFTIGERARPPESSGRRRLGKEEEFERKNRRFSYPKISTERKKKNSSQSFLLWVTFYTKQCKEKTCSFFLDQMKYTFFKTWHCLQSSFFHILHAEKSLKCAIKISYHRMCFSHFYNS